MPKGVKMAYISIKKIQLEQPNRGTFLCVINHRKKKLNIHNLKNKKTCFFFADKKVSYSTKFQFGIFTHYEGALQQNTDDNFLEKLYFENYFRKFYVDLNFCSLNLSNKSPMTIFCW